MSQTTNNAIVNGVTYMSFNDPNGGTTSIQGIRGVTDSENVYLAGSLSGTDGTTVYGLIYEGPIANEGKSGNWYQYAYPGDNVINTSCYGPNNGPNGTIQVVGSYKTTESVENKQGETSNAIGAMGFLYQGPVNGTGGEWITLHPHDDHTLNCYAHSTMGGLVVGCYDVRHTTNGHSFIYDIATKVCVEFKVEGSFITSVYGIWHNGGNSYTLAGGYTVVEDGTVQGFIADYDSATKKTSNLKGYTHPRANGKSSMTHFQGITGATGNGYNLPAGWVGINEDGIEHASFVHIPRNTDGTFGDATWVDLIYPSSTGSNKKCITLATSADKNNITGIYIDGAASPSVTFSYIATV